VTANLTVSVVVPSYRRTADLKRCLCALSQQALPPDEVLVVVRDTDDETREFLKEPKRLTSLRVVVVDQPGQIAALNAGINATTTDIVALTDDDAEPSRDWVERIVATFLTDSKVGGVGGRDWVYHGEIVLDGSEPVVGKLQWFGRMIGNHHLGVGPIRDVDFLKGVNSAYRREALTGTLFDSRMRGDGAQVHQEVSVGLSLKQRGWRLVYDPQIVVKHFPAARFDSDRRDGFNAAAVRNAVHNETIAVFPHLSALGQFVYPLWAILLGTGAAPGLLMTVRLVLKRDRYALWRLIASLCGRHSGYWLLKSKS